MVKRVWCKTDCINTEMWGWLMGNWCKYRKYKCWLYCCKMSLSRKIGVFQRRKLIARWPGWWWLGRIQKIRMVEYTPHHPQYVHTFLWWKIIWRFNIGFKYDFILQAKVCMTAKRKTTYSPVIWWHITLARLYMRKYE